MKPVTSANLTHLAKNLNTLAVCWKVTLRNGNIIYGTNHDADLTINAGDFAGTYHSQAGITGSDLKTSDDMSVDNSEVTGGLSDNILIPDIKAADAEAGILNYANVDMFFVNWQAPNDGQVLLPSGFLGQFQYDNDGAYKTEIRGITQALAQNFIQTYSERCNVAKFGDSRCKLNVPAMTLPVTVTGVVNRRNFTVQYAGAAPSGASSGTPTPVPNGDFELGNNGDWILSSTDVGIGGAFPYQGILSAIFALDHDGQSVTTAVGGTVTSGQVVTASAQLDPNNNGADMEMYLIMIFSDAGGTQLSTITSAVQEGFGYRKVTVTGTAPVGASNVKLKILAGTGTHPNPAYADSVEWDLSIGGFGGVLTPFTFGNLTGTSGTNNGYLRQIKQTTNLVTTNPASWTVFLFEPFPTDVMVGDTFNLAPGCDRLWTTCKNVYNNLDNFRGYGLFIPGIDALLAGPSASLPATA